MEAAELFYTLETALLEKMLRTLCKGKVGTDRWKLQRIAETARLRREASRMIRQTVDRATEEAAREIRREAHRGVHNVDALSIGHRKNLSDLLPVADNPQTEAIVKAWTQQAADAFNRTGATMLAQVSEMYTEAADLAALRHIMGEITGREAIGQLAGAWARDGITALIDSAGRHWTPEAYAQMIVRSSQRQATTEAQFERMDEMNEDLVEISSHAGARPLCAPYQGRIFSRSGKSDKYPPLSETSYGEPAGLFGINCGHVAYPYFEGMHRTYSPYPEKQNAETYAESQQQRKLERNIRGAKRAEVLAEAAGDSEGARKAHAKVLEGQQRMREFLNDTGRTRRYDREQIYTGEK